MVFVNALSNLLFGGSLLVWGRKLFWLFVAAAGFFTGWQIGTRIVGGPPWLGIVIGIFFAIGGALLAVFLKSIAIGVAGFLMGGAVLMNLAGFINLDQGFVGWAVYLVGGIGGVILINMFFDWALIVLSSLGGAALIVQAFGMDATVARLLTFGALLVLGLVIQSRQLAKEK